jgi:hypothetical protein
VHMWIAVYLKSLVSMACILSGLCPKALDRNGMRRAWLSIFFLSLQLYHIYYAHWQTLYLV